MPLFNLDLHLYHYALILFLPCGASTLSLSLFLSLSLYVPPCLPQFCKSVLQTPPYQNSKTREREMRLLTHNMLSSNIKGVTNGFPLLIEAVKVIEKQVDYNPEFLKNMFAKVDWKALVGASRAVGYTELPEESGASDLESEEFLRRFHRALLELDVEEGALVCPETARRFPISKGIPNMLLHEDEV